MGVGVDGIAGSIGTAEIRAEAEYLATARAALGRMRADVVATETPEFVSGTDEVWFNQMYRLARAQRREDLVDLPDVPLFFGRLDYEPGTSHEDAAAGGDPDRVYVGRRHVRDDEGTPLVVDWRAPVSMPFYRATREHPHGVRLSRRYGFSDTAQLTAYEDEPLIGAATGQPSALLTRRDRTARGPDRCATSWRPSSPSRTSWSARRCSRASACRARRAPGKTAVGLHRLAYLLYTEPSRLTGGVTVVGPNRSFLAYIRHVLPALGEVSVQQKTIDELIGRPVTGTDTPEAARLKGDARMAEVLRRALWGHVGEPDEDLVYVHGATRYRVARGRVAQIVADLRGGTRYGPGRDGVAQRLASLVVTQMERRGATPDDRELAAVARSKPVRQLRRHGVAQAHPGAGPVPAPVRSRLPCRRRRRAAHGRRAGDAAVGQTVPVGQVGQVVRGRRRAARRTGRPHRPYAVVEPRHGRRGAGPQPDAVPGARPAVRHRIAHGPGRHRPGHERLGGR